MDTKLLFSILLCLCELAYDTECKGSNKKGYCKKAGQKFERKHVSLSMFPDGKKLSLVFLNVQKNSYR